MLSCIWDRSQLHAIPNPEYPPLKIYLSLFLFYAKKKSLQNRRNESIITYLEPSKKNQNCKWAKNSPVTDTHTSAHFFGKKQANDHLFI